MQHQLAIDVKKLGEQIKGIQLYNRVMQNNCQTNQEQQTLDSEEVLHISNEICNQIQYALSLDLQRRPSLSRTNAGNKSGCSVFLFNIY